MKIQIASDLHIEFPENKEFLMRNPLKPVGDILILGGDIVPFQQMDEHHDFFDYLSLNFGLTYWLPGNHEYYHSDLHEKPFTLYEKVRDNIFLVNNILIESGNTNLIFSTLWTRIDPSNEYELQLSYSDFRAIRNDGWLLNIEQYNSMHDKCLAFLKEKIKSINKGNVIVITHHMPTFQNYPEEYRESPISEAFAVELKNFIQEAQPDYWIFGHHHNNRGDFSIDKTRLVTNQLGYVMYNEQKRFDPGKIIEI
jgi:predicted phosphohydrolase